MKRMGSVEHQKRRRSHRCIANAAVLALGLLAAGCSTDRLFGGSGSTASPEAANSSPSLGDRFASFFTKRPAQPQASGTAAATPQDQDIDCPTVTIRPGTSTFAVSAAGAEPNAMSLRYQATFGQSARECKLAGATLTMRVGVEGRVILGPAGGPGQLDVPLRYAVVQEGPEPKTIVTKLRWFTVAIPPGETNVPFMQIEEDLSFPMPRGNDLEAYVVYIGFDRAAVKEPEKKTPAKKQPPKPRRAT
jgi:hypothetical protein